MSFLETARRPPRDVAPRYTEAELCGWGRTRRSTARLVDGRDIRQLQDLIVGAPPGGVIARGSGRSYGDPAQNGGGVVVDMTAMNKVGRPTASSGPETGPVRVEAGATLAAVLEVLHPRGLTLPVLPGTAHATVGGALAADVHGKNHPAAGSFGAQTVSLELLTPEGEQLRVSREMNPDLFAATIGGMGLTGMILAATLRTTPLPTPFAVADIDRCSSLEDALELIAAGTHSHAIAWLDLLSGGRGFTRAVVTRSREGVRVLNGASAGGPLPSAGADGTPKPTPRRRPAVPERLPAGVLRPGFVRAFNEALWLRAVKPARDRPLSVDQQLFPLDGVERWNNLYGPGGFVQYQFAAPDGREHLLRSVLELLRRAGLPMYLATVKRFGARSGGLLSFPVPGWTLAVDIPAAAPDLGAALDQADALVAEAGGRVYLAKDSRMRAETMCAMYPQLERFSAIRAKLDPLNVLRSDLARRLELSL